MPIVLSLTGQLDLGDRRLSRNEARDWLARAAVWFEGVGDAVLDTRLMRDSEDKPVLLVDLHPAAAPAELRLGASGKLRVTAATTPAGPGYHQHLCGLLRHLATDFGFPWVGDDCADPTGFFTTRDRGRTEQHFLRWLAGVAAGSPPAIGLPAAHGFSYPAEVFTPLGPRSRAWLAVVASEPERGAGFFAWWEPDLDATFYRNRALARMWCDFTWRPPLTEGEGETTDQIANDLATAFKLDPAAELPWVEWLELLTAIEADAAGEQFCVTPKDSVLSVELWKRSGAVPAKANGPRIGYRRHPVRVALDGGWSVEVPGSFAREWDDDRNWTAWDRTRTVWFRRLGFTKPGGAAPSTAEALEVGQRSLPEGEPVPGLDADGVCGTAVFGPAEEDGRTVWRLSGVAGRGGAVGGVQRVHGIGCGSRLGHPHLAITSPRPQRTRLKAAGKTVARALFPSVGLIRKLSPVFCPHSHHPMMGRFAMKRFAVAGSLMLAAMAGVVLADDKKDLDGMYTVTVLEKAGKSAPKEVIESIKITIKGEDFTIVIKEKDKDEEKKAKIKTDASKTPNTIDITPSDGPEKGKTFPGIYKIEKGEVTLVFTEKGDRPKEFKSEGEVMLVKMKKDEKK